MSPTLDSKTPQGPQQHQSCKERIARRGRCCDIHRNGHVDHFTGSRSRACAAGTGERLGRRLWAGADGAVGAVGEVAQVQIRVVSSAIFHRQENELVSCASTRFVVRHAAVPFLLRNQHLIDADALLFQVAGVSAIGKRLAGRVGVAEGLTLPNTRRTAVSAWNNRNAFPFQCTREHLPRGSRAGSRRCCTGTTAIECSVYCHGVVFCYHRVSRLHALVLEMAASGWAEESE
mmetsp:Transcript_30824/g.57801  ORF Transcript_30824/g.57801 Transcript_30824/m.57801 type:complete len:232 (+) Transcript_30824:80-775(+)